MGGHNWTSNTSYQDEPVRTIWLLILLNEMLGLKNKIKNTTRPNPMTEPRMSLQIAFNPIKGQRTGGRGGGLGKVT